MALIRLLCNRGMGSRIMGWGETSLLAMAGGFLGWQPILAAASAALVPGLTMATWEWARGRRHISFVWWLAAAVAGVWFGWFWIGPLVQGLFFDPRRLLWFAVGSAAMLLAFAAGLGLAGSLKNRGASS